MAIDVAAVPTTDATAGFQSLREETRVERLAREGAIPEWLHGTLVRTGPAVWDVGDRTLAHWFDGQAMLHRFGIADGEVSYANRMLQTKAWRAIEETGEIAYSEFATDPCRSLFARVNAIFSPQISDNANVNLVRLGEQWTAMTETPIAVAFDERTLETAGVAWEAPGQLTTAHPHLDRANQGMINFAAQLGPRSRYRFFSLAPGATEPTVLAESVTRTPGYVHSFGLTPRWLILAESPFVVDPLSIVLSGRPYIENYRWEPERGLRFHLYDRQTGRHSGPLQTDARFLFHHVNAFDDGDEVVVDICTFPDAGIVDDLYLGRLRAGAPVAHSSVERFRLRPDSAAVTVEPLTELGFELPRINYGRCNERPYRRAWGVTSEDGWLDRIVAADVTSGETAIWHEPGCWPGEPVFVARPGAEAEDDGVLLSVVLGPNGRSFLLVLDAATLQERARAEVPHHIPFGFHGQFASA